MSDFNAGSIGGTLELDNTPFKAGLAWARAQAADFESKKITPTLGLDSTEFDAKRAAASVSLDKYDHTKVSARADLDISEALSKFAILKSVLDAGGLGSGITSFALMGAKVFALTGGVLGLLAAMGPLAGVLGGVGAAGIAAFGGIAISLALFAAAMKNAVGILTTANKAGVTLTGWAGEAQKQLAGMTGAWHSLMAVVHPEMFQILALTFHTMAFVLPMLAPLLNTTAKGVGSIVAAIAGLVHTDVFANFLHELQVFMGGFLQGAGPVIVNLLASFMNIFVALQPLMSIIGKGIEEAASKFERFTEDLQNGGITPFIHYVRQALPEVIGLFGDLFGGIHNLLAGLAPLAAPALRFIGALVVAIGNLHLAPLAQGFGDLFDALAPLLKPLGQLVNVFLGPLGHLLSDIAQNAVTPLADSITHNLQPAFGALHTILHALVAPLSAFIASIANLANPTGVAALSALLVGLSGAVVKLAPSFGALAVALESVIDDALSVIIPMIPTLTAALGPVVAALAGVAGGLAAILSHKTVVDVLLALGGAVWIGVKAFEAMRAVQEIVVGLQAAYATAMLGSAAATDAGGASLVIYVARLVAMKIAQAAAAVGTFALAAATVAWTAAQWLLNAALTANPIGIVIVAIAALVAGLIYAYKHSETFRNIVNGAFTAVKTVAGDVLHWLTGAVMTAVDFIRNHWQLMLAILTGPIGLAVYFLKSHWSAISNGFSNMISDVKNVVSTGIGDVVGFFTALPGKITGLVGQMITAGKSLMGGIFHGLESAASSVGGFAANIAQSIWHELESVLNNILPHELRISKGPIHVTVPLFPMLAQGGVTNGPTMAGIGDNPGGHEAVVPLDQYDIPKRGDLEAIAGRAEATNSRMVELLAMIAGHLTGQKPLDPDELAEKIAQAAGTVSDANMRRMVQVGRAA